MDETASEARLSEIRCLVLDVDGTLTDGRLFMDATTGEEWRAFYVHDGVGIRMFQDAGGVVIWCTGKSGGSVAHRARTLNVEHVIQNSHDKLADLTALLDKLGIGFEQVAMMGDDLNDVSAMRRCAMPIAPANARPEVQAIARLVTERSGGDGAVREAIEFLMKEDDRWDDALRRFGVEP